jgi:uncharacterized protein with NAD-binding domain and iron-sulfur cluster
VTDRSGARKREKVAVLGGGVAGLTAALELSATPELRDRYEITVYQLGWRCGGKCATGRDPANASRVEEHGLHLWFGGYDNSFKLLATCYDELARPAGAPLATMDDAWHPLSCVLLYDDSDGQWSFVRRRFAIAPGRPWEDALVPRWWNLIFIVLQWISPRLRESQARDLQRQLRARDRRMRFGSVIARGAGNMIQQGLVAGAHAWVRWQRKRDPTRERAHPTACVAEHVRSLLLMRARRRMHDRATRQGFAHVDVLLTSLIGIIRDDVLWRGFDSINDLDFREWLVKHGVQPETLTSPDVRVAYDESFANATGPNAIVGGSPASAYKPDPAFAAGAALYGLLRTELPYRGSVMWQPKAGMGDTVFAPMYDTLVKRGVCVEFFQGVTKLGVDPVRHVVDHIEVVQQARPIGLFDPLIDVKGLRCWPAYPKWDQLEDGDELRTRAVDFERGEAEADASTRTLTLGEHFDTVVLAISAAALPPICFDLMAVNPAFANMLRHTSTVMTQAFQVWLTTPPAQLGFEHEHAATSTFIEPLDTGCDNSQVLDSEDWPAGNEPASLWYFCGVLPDVAGDDATVTTQRAKDGAIHYLNEIGAQWPEAVAGGQFRWDLLVAPASTQGKARFDSQYWRANSAPTERYVQTPPGSLEHRLRADESGFSNLYLAGDWTRNGFNIGAVEAAVMSGMQASRAISGSPQYIAWEGGMWTAC